MDFTLGMIKSESQVLLRSFRNDQSSVDKIMELEDSKDNIVDGLILPETLATNTDLLTFLNDEKKFLPIQTDKIVNIDFEQFAKISDTQAKNIFDKLQSTWLLDNNIGLLEELFTVLDHLKKLLTSDRTSFFEELWFILKSNIGAQDLTIIYNDIVLAKKDSEKNKLTRAKVEGTKTPLPLPGTDIDEKLMTNYTTEFGPIFEVVEYDKEKGHITCVAKVNNSPVLIMAKINNITRLQKALIGSLFDGLNSH